MKWEALFSSKSDNWETPQAFFDELNAEHHFTLDVCSFDENTKCSRHFTPRENGLLQKWEGRCWMNPPYGREIRYWMEKAYKSARDGDCDLVCCLVPSRTDTAWWHDYAMKGEITFVRGRLKFGGSTGNAPFPSAVVLFKKGEVK